MSRYRIALGKNVKPKMYNFRPTNSAIRVGDYMKKCIEEGVMLNASNITSAILDSAVIRLSKEYKVPIIVESKSDARILIIGHDYKYIYSKDEIPNFAHTVICYSERKPIPLPPHLTVMLTILKG